MRKKILVFLSLALIVLLGFSVFMSFILLSNRTQQNIQGGQRSRMPMIMRPGMMRMTGAFINSEYEFLVHMIPHHEEAIFTANVLKENTENEEMKQFAEGIISTQTYEIEQMITWLATWYADEKDHDIDYQPMMRNLEGLKGEELEEAFLEDMIPHHMEAIMMSQQLVSRGLVEHEEVAYLVRDIRNTQRDEIHFMIDWMSNWNGNTPIATRNYGIILLWVGSFALAITLLTVWLITTVLSLSSKSEVSSGKSAKEMLDIRYATGEIFQAEYLKSRKNLES